MNFLPCAPLTAPPTRQEVLAVIHQLEPVDIAAAAAHLLTPLDVAVGLQVKVEGGWVSWRGEQERVSGKPWAGIVSAVADVVSRGRVEGDEFLSLAGDRVSLLKLVRSGAYCHLVGACELFDAPQVTFSAHVPAHLARVVAQMFAEGATPPTGEMYLDGTLLLVRSSASASHVDVA